MISSLDISVLHCLINSCWIYSHDVFLIIFLVQIWFKKGVNVSEGMIRSWFKDMAEITGLGGYFLNQSGRSTAMTRSLISLYGHEALLLYVHSLVQ
jgi:hypothetical protein